MTGRAIKPLDDMRRLETLDTLKAAAAAEAALGELKGVVKTVPDEAVLLNTLPMQEALASSAIENIVTTQDELFRGRVDDAVSPAAKEVLAHADALLEGYRRARQKRVLRLEDVLDIQQILVKNRAGLRAQAGTVLKNGAGEVVYTPPPPREIPALMDNLLRFINDDDMSALNPLMKMAVIHHQFESIHPFYDGNGRAGRILNLLYLVLQKRLDAPVLYLSGYIIRRKGEYYRLLQAVREQGDWREWLLYMLRGVEETARQTIDKIAAINALRAEYERVVRADFPNMYSRELIDSLFRGPYTKIDFVRETLNCTRLTAARYLNQLAAAGFLSKIRAGRSNYYLNLRLMNRLITPRQK